MGRREKVFAGVIAPQVNAAVGGSILLLVSLFSEMGYNVTPKARESVRTLFR